MHSLRSSVHVIDCTSTIHGYTQLSLRGRSDVESATTCLNQQIASVTAERPKFHFLAFLNVEPNRSIRNRVILKGNI